MHQLMEVNELFAPIKTPANIQRLKDILSLCRKHNSPGERKMAEQILMPYKPVIYVDDTVATKEVIAYGIEVLDNDESSKVIWSCHIDTVHSSMDATRQAVIYDESTQLMFKQDGQPLGADDGAGVWLLLEMIDHKVPGMYLFHRGEECGGIGSRAMAKIHESWLKKFTHAIAFDRRNDCSIITRQSRGTCCSNKFAAHFGSMLSDEVYQLLPDNGGTFTDTANYMPLIAECTNVSIGYQSEHTGNELLDVAYLLWLRDKMIDIDVAKLASVVDRDPAKVEVYQYGGYQAGRNWKQDALEVGDDDWWGRYPPTYPATSTRNQTPRLGPAFDSKARDNVKPIGTKKSKPKTAPAPMLQTPIDRGPQTADQVLDMKAHELHTWVRSARPWDVVTLIIELAIKAAFKEMGK